MKVWKEQQRRVDTECAVGGQKRELSLPGRAGSQQAAQEEGRLIHAEGTGWATAERGSMPPTLTPGTAGTVPVKGARAQRRRGQPHVLCFWVS